ncbi:MAG: TRC40/GET3/ArsA family transport-energizing ATPase [Candidatus Riflebacteria bacterium]|nr:TRC40/GET3/ArsA family transport-energizing ATPase [Candidatus Riflebacteria bacterium]
MRIIIITGKGGVGKTSIAAATAVKAAQFAHKTLVMSTDSAHSLGDSFDLQLGSEPVEISDNLFGLEVDTRKELSRYWSNIQAFIRKTVQARGIDSVLAEELSVLPGMEELFSLLLLKEYYQTKAYDLVIVDCAPTASTIRQLSFPEVGSWYLQKIFPIQRAVVGMARPFAEKIYEVNLPDEGVFDNIRNLILSLEGMKEILVNPAITTVRFVLNLEKMVIKEIQRANMYMNLFGYNVDGVFVNKIFSEALTDPYLDRWKKIQSDNMLLVESSFSPIPIFKAPLFEQEVVGIELLEKLGEVIYDEKDPANVFNHTPPIQLHMEGQNCILKWRLPNLKKSEIDLFTKGDELILQTPLYQRNLPLPRALLGKTLKEAHQNGEHLIITFT